ncbi:hypothetical protein FB567DRAFT_510631 [Paraphoma chrysanthemicola]|uniref:Uncharacterized protein n=1 Tax=Paraphoma chrysanthemicola TaxID=798071 RepID=A0A8K0RJQ9_9PLEO|nr:hypothetical protein FB567DRAFT_510631 [Paraphoma chrysanthemicola]
MSLQLEDGKSLSELLQQCRVYLYENRITMTFLGTTIEYVPNSILLDVTSRENITKLLKADIALLNTKYRNVLDSSAEDIYQWARKLLAITLKSGITSPLSFVLDMIAKGTNDKLFPFDPTTHAALIPNQYRVLFNNLFIPTQRKVLAPSFASRVYDRKIPSLSILPLLSYRPIQDFVGEPEFWVLFHPAHLIEGFSPNREMKMKVFTDLKRAELFRNKVICFHGFHCEGKYFCVF